MNDSVEMVMLKQLEGLKHSVKVLNELNDNQAATIDEHYRVIADLNEELAAHQKLVLKLQKTRSLSEAKQDRRHIKRLEERCAHVERILKATKEMNRSQVTTIEDLEARREDDLTDLAAHGKDLADAAGALMVALPAPGTDLAKVLRVNREINRLRVTERSAWTDQNGRQAARIQELEKQLKTQNPMTAPMTVGEYHKLCSICGRKTDADTSLSKMLDKAVLCLIQVKRSMGTTKADIQQTLDNVQDLLSGVLGKGDDA